MHFEQRRDKGDAGAGAGASTTVDLHKGKKVLLRGAIVNRTYGIHQNYIFILFSNNIGSYQVLTMVPRNISNCLINDSGMRLVLTQRSTFTREKKNTTWYEVFVYQHDAAAYLAPI